MTKRLLGIVAVLTFAACGSYGAQDNTLSLDDEKANVGVAEQEVKFNSGLYQSPFDTGEWGVCHDIGGDGTSYGGWAPGTAGGCETDYNLALAQCRDEWMCTNGADYCVDVAVQSPRCKGFGGADVDMECCGFQWCQICKCKGGVVSDPSLPNPP